MIDHLRTSGLNDFPVAEHGDSIRHGQRLALIVGDEDEGNAERLLQAFQFFLHGFTQFQIKCAKRLVQQQHFWLVDESTSQRHALPLTAGELAGLARTARSSSPPINRCSR